MISESFLSIIIRGYNIFLIINLLITDTDLAACGQPERVQLLIR